MELSGISAAYVVLDDPRLTGPHRTPETTMQDLPREDATQQVALAPLFLRMPTVLRVTGLGRSTIYRLIAEHKFPGPVRLGARAVAWRRSDIVHWSEERKPSSAH